MDFASSDPLFFSFGEWFVVLTEGFDLHWMVFITFRYIIPYVGSIELENTLVFNLIAVNKLMFVEHIAWTSGFEEDEWIQYHSIRPKHPPAVFDYLELQIFKTFCLSLPTESRIFMN